MVYTYIYTYTVKYYSAIFLKSEIFPFTMTWIDVEGILVSETNQTKTNTI